MTIGSLGKALANQAIESTKNTVLDAVRTPEPAKPAEPGPPGDTSSLGAMMLGQIQAMQRPLKEDQELLVSIRAGEEMLRVLEIFVPGPQILVFSGIDSQGNVTRVISPVEAVQVVCKILKISSGANPVRVNILTPKPAPRPAA
jgi:hypothetical protein